jgi:hypothetical protein
MWRPAPMRSLEWEPKASCWGAAGTAIVTCVLRNILAGFDSHLAAV